MSTKQAGPMDQSREDKPKKSPERPEPGSDRGNKPEPARREPKNSPGEEPPQRDPSSNPPLDAPTDPDTERKEQIIV